ncbi:MAG: O-antigen ligase family protein [Gammaproteobacteria bacterium]|nr:O-antigen ligase family protein [Gammaproteobacteria bacterium]MCW8909296.1 O-antigen ligase family protein [Gammaproteobacteria bacterium]MCW9006253.1 O-antigen ligase family protein [Gammaproteobacteria bacterium]MCW9055424.1 O-antigen ligase family protein [Gammaproteobacteria bacterium]
MNSESLNPDITNRWFFFILFYLFIDYGRPQDILPISFMKPGMIATAILVYYLLNNGISLSKSNQTRMIWYFVILTALHIPFAVNNYWALQTTLNMVQFVPFILSVTICVNSINRLKKVIDFLIILMAYISVYSLFHKGYGPGAIFFDENDVAIYVNIWLPFCFFLFMYENEFKRKLFYGIAMAAGVTAIVVSFSRGGFVGLLAVGFFIWIFSTKKMLSLMLIFLVGLFVYYYSGEVYLNEMSTVTDQNEGTAQARLQSWTSGWYMFLDNPLGVGGNNFQWRFVEYQTDWFGREMGGRVAHSLWFTLIPELGVFGVIIYFKLLVYNVKDAFFLKSLNIEKNRDIEYLHALALSFIAALAGFFASATFLSVLYYPHYWYLTAVIIATRMIYNNYQSQDLKGSLAKV